MTNTSRNSHTIYDQLADWLNDIKQHELNDIVELVEKAKAVIISAQSIPEEKVKQFTDNFKYDLHEFYQQNQSQAKHSIYLGLLNETFWSNLAQLTDKSQVEWAEIADDFEHQGLYHSGDYIGFGELECQKCHQSITLYHLTQISDCVNCGGTGFVRKALTP